MSAEPLGGTGCCPAIRLRWGSCRCCTTKHPLWAKQLSDPADGPATVCLTCHREARMPGGSYIPPVPIVAFLIEAWISAEQSGDPGLAQRVQVEQRLLDLTLEQATWQDHYHGPAEISGGLCGSADPARLEGVRLLAVLHQHHDGWRPEWVPSGFDLDGIHSA